MTALTDVLAYITGEADEADITRINDTIKIRNRILKDQRAALVATGMEARTRNLSPKALNGLTGTVESINGKRADLLLDADSTLALRFSRTRWGAAVPAGATEYLLVGVPLSSCEPVTT